MRAARPHGLVVAVTVGTYSSNHDRACEVFAQLFGTLTDYGETHSARCGHIRYGGDFTGKALLPRWDAAHPVHLVGHSFGGNTALTLISLLAQDFWGVGSSAAWVLSVATICSPLRGCALPFAWGLDPEKPCRPCEAPSEASDDERATQTTGVDEESPECAHSSGGGGCDRDRRAESQWCRTGQVPRMGSLVHGLVCAMWPLWRAQQAWPWLRGLYNMGTDQWDEHSGWYNTLTMRHPFWINGDNTLVDAIPTACAAELRLVRKHLQGIYLVSVTSDTHVVPVTTPSDAQLRRAKIATAVGSAAAALLIVHFRKELRVLLSHLHGGAKRRYVLLLGALAALLRHRAVKQLRSPRLLAVVAAGFAALVAAAAAAAAAAASVMGIPLRLPRDQQLAVLRPWIAKIRPVVHAYLLPWLVRPAFRLNATAIRRAAALLQGELKVSFVDDNDGLVDLPSHVGVDTTIVKKRSDAPAIRGAASMSSLDHYASRCMSLTQLAGNDATGGGGPARNFSHGDYLSDVSSFSSVVTSNGHGGYQHHHAADGGSQEGEGEEGVAHVVLEKGRWHIMRVPGADHSLGTWASEKSDAMYRRLFAVLDGQARSQRHAAGI